MSTRRYKAFISYSHQDESWASWLHRALETYRIPGRLVGSYGTFGPVPRRLSPVFRDRDELSSSPDLNARVRDVLEDSESLVVVCSPAAAQSRWVNEEIRLFRLLGRGDRIFCIIVDGDPQSPNPDETCFPPALLETSVGETHEPLAADARKWVDGKQLAKLKLVSGILGMRLDDLRMREQKRKTRKQVLVGLTAVIFISLGVSAVLSKLSEKARVEHAETLVSQMVEFSKDLEKVADLETLRKLSERLASYLETLDPDDLSDASSLQIALVLRRLGQVSRLQGRPKEAMEAFTRSRDILNGLALRSPGDQSAVFELGQAEFWVGYLLSDKGDWDQATEAFTEYLQVSKRLHRQEPENAEWAMEMAYAFTNLGMIEEQRVPVDKQKVLEYMNSAMEYNQLAVELDSAEEYYQLELANSHAGLADAWMEICDLDSALTARLQNVAFAVDFYNRDPTNKQLKEKYSYSLSGLAWVQDPLGLNEQAIMSLKESMQLLAELSSQDPSNLKYRWNLYQKSAWLAEQFVLTGQFDEAWNLSADTDRGFRQLALEDESISLVNGVAYSRFLMGYSEQAWSIGDSIMAKRWLDEAIQRIEEIVSINPDSSEALYQLKRSYLTYWKQNERVLSEEMMAMLVHYAYSDPSNLSCKQADLSARISIVTGDKQQANVYTTYLMEKAYGEPEFIKFCREHDLCNE